MLDRIRDIVRSIRERENWSLDDLALRSAVPVEVLAALEKGQPGISTTQLGDLASALSVDPLALLHGHELPRPTPSVFLRHHPVQDFDNRDALILDDALEQGRLLASLRSMLGEPILGLQTPQLFVQREASSDRPDAPAQDGYQLAREVRRWLNNTADRHMDLRAMLEECFGVAVVIRPLVSSGMTAASVRSRNTGVIVLNSSDSQRLTNPLLTRVHLCHELCHLLFDPSNGGLHLVIDRETDKAIHAAEQRARAFAAEMLLPREGLLKLLGTPHQVDVPAVALDLVARARSYFGTPHEIAANHLCNQRFVHIKLREWLEAEKADYRGNLPETSLPLANATSLHVANLVEQAHRKTLITDGEARQILRLDRLDPLPWRDVHT